MAESKVDPIVTLELQHPDGTKGKTVKIRVRKSEQAKYRKRFAKRTTPGENKARTPANDK